MAVKGTTDAIQCPAVTEKHGSIGDLDRALMSQDGRVLFSQMNERSYGASVGRNLNPQGGMTINMFVNDSSPVVLRAVSPKLK